MRAMEKCTQSVVQLMPTVKAEGEKVPQDTEVSFTRTDVVRRDGSFTLVSSIVSQDDIRPSQRLFVRGEEIQAVPVLEMRVGRFDDLTDDELRDYGFPI